MRAPFLALLLVGCRPAASGAPATTATIAFVAPPGSSMHDWRFDVHGLPAIDTRSGELLVADTSRERSFGWDPVALLSLRPGAPPRTVNLLVDSSAIGDLHVIEDENEEIRSREPIAAGVREQTRIANAGLAGRTLRPLTACHLSPDAPMIFCTHPQKLTCGETTFELDDDALRWRGGAVRTAWQIPPIDIGDGPEIGANPPHKMLACIEEAHLDAPTMQLAIRYHQVCEGGGSDACILRDEWRVLEASGRSPR